MDLVAEAVKAVALLLVTAIAIFAVPLIFMLIFSLASGFSEHSAPRDRP